MRWIPALKRYSSLGSVVLLRSVCSLASFIDDPQIDEVLASAFYRWLTWFARNSDKVQHQENHPLWQTFHALSRHPRFKRIPNFDIRLAEICQLRLHWVHAESIVNTILDQPRSYAFLECRLIKAAPFEIYLYDEVDKLDDAADKLFRAVQS